MLNQHYIESINSAFNTAFSETEAISDVILNLIYKFSFDSEKLIEIARKSYKHVNGFTKIVLHDSTDKGIKVRLHVWDETYQKRETDLHDHRWSYLSVPILGSFVEKRFKENGRHEIAELEKIQYKCYSRGDTEWLNLDGYEKVSLSQNFEQVRRVNELYFCDAGTIHQLEPVELPSATLIITFDPIREYARVYRNKIETEDFMKIYVPNLAPEDILKEFAFIKSNL